LVSLQPVAKVKHHVKFMCAAIDRPEMYFEWTVNTQSEGFVHHTEHRSFNISRQDDHLVQTSLLFLESGAPSNGTVQCKALDANGTAEYVSEPSAFLIMSDVVCDSVQMCDKDTSSCRETPDGGIECACDPGYSLDEDVTAFCLVSRDLDQDCFSDWQCESYRSRSRCLRGFCRCTDPYLQWRGRCAKLASFGGCSGTGADPASGPTRSLSPAASSSSRPVVRDEEIVIVVLVLTVWVAVILLFFNKWGKIRMLEPYQPQYQREPQFSTSSSLGPPPVLLKTTGAVERELRRLSSVASNYYVGGVTAAGGASRLHRIRQNSVFVGSQILVAPLPRRYKSAEDIKSMVVQIEHQASTQSTAL
ncbi:unnamed protein product, partial [Ixodes hexagonus]